MKDYCDERRAALAERLGENYVAAEWRIDAKVVVKLDGRETREMLATYLPFKDYVGEGANGIPKAMELR